jgi:hypothetical protein
MDSINRTCKWTHAMSARKVFSALRRTQPSRLSAQPADTARSGLQYLSNVPLARSALPWVSLLNLNANLAQKGTIAMA